MTSGAFAAVRHDARGALLLEAFIAFAPVWLLFVCVCQTCDLFAHQLIVQRAAAAAARAAVVILPDDGARYDDKQQLLLHQFAGERKRAVEAAALGLLGASRQFVPGTSHVSVRGRFQPGTRSDVELSVDYACLIRGVPLLCGRSGKLRLSAAARLSYQGARYVYPERG